MALEVDDVAVIRAFRRVALDPPVCHGVERGLNAYASRLAVELVDDVGEWEPEGYFDLTHLWDTSDAVRTRPRSATAQRLRTRYRMPGAD